MIKSRTIFLFSGFIALFLLSSPLYAAKLIPVGDGTKFSGTASVSVSISGPRYGTNGIEDPVSGFDGSGYDFFDQSAGGEAIQYKQIHTMVKDDVVDSWTEEYDVIHVSTIIGSSQGLDVTWYNSGTPEEMNQSVSKHLAGGVPAWVEDYANQVSLGVQIFSADVDMSFPSYRKYITDFGATVNHTNNDDIDSLSISVSVGQTPDSAEFTIEPMLLEQAGDEIQVTIENNTPWIEFSNYNGASAFDTTATTSGSVKINGTIVSDTSSGVPVTITAQIGDTVTLSSAASLTAGPVGTYKTPTPDNSSANDYRLYSATVTKGLIVQVAEAAGVSEENPIIGNSGQTIIFPAVPIESGGPGIDVPVWFRTPDGTALEIQVNGVGLSAFEMPGELPVGPQPPGEIEGSVAVWYDDSGTWVEHALSPVPPGGKVDLSPGVTRIQLRGIDRTAPDPADNLFNAGLYFDGATTGAQVTISSVSAASLAPVINLLLGD